MISPSDVIRLVQEALRPHDPDARVEVFDKTGESNHFIVFVVSRAFAGQSVLACMRMVNDALRPAMADGRLHAAEIKTQVPETV